MRTHTAIARPQQCPHLGLGLAVGLAWIFLLTAPAHAGTRLAPNESADLGVSIEPSDPTPTGLALDPIEPQQLQRIDPQDSDASRDLAELRRLADSPAVRAQLKSKRRPKGSSTLAAGNAAWTLGLVYLHGAGVPQDLAQAEQWFERAIALGARQALAGMAWCAIDGCAQMPEPQKANRWTSPLRAINRPLALYLQWLAQDRLAPLRTAKPDLQSSDAEPTLVAPQLLITAARAGNIHALIELGLSAAANQDAERALQYFQKAAPQSTVAAANAAIVKQSLEPASAPPSDANKVALELLTQAQRFHRGEGVPTNYAEAIRLYQLAAGKGSLEAERMLALIYSRPLVRGSVDIAWVSQLSGLDLKQSTPSLRLRTAPRQLQRESTALIDQLPAKWRQRIL